MSFLQEYEAIKKLCKREKINDGQYTLGRLIEHIEKIIENFSEDDLKDCNIFYNFSDLFPTSFDSWRGSYDELALGYDNFDNKKPHNVKEFLKIAKEAIGGTFYGYKGGEFTMDKDTPIWIDNYGNASDTVICDVLERYGNIYLDTKYCKY